MSVLLSFGLGACFRGAPGGQGYFFPLDHHHNNHHHHHQQQQQQPLHQQVFFIIPCLDVYQKIDMRTSSYDVPPQEVRVLPSPQSLTTAILVKKNYLLNFPSDPDEGQCDCVCQCNHVL